MTRALSAFLVLAVTVLLGGCAGVSGLGGPSGPCDEDEGGRPLWTSGFEGGLAEGWRAIQQAPGGPGASSVVMDGAPQGRRVGQFRLLPGVTLPTDGTSRQQLAGTITGGGDDLVFDEGDDLYFGYSLKLGDRYPTDSRRWQVLLSWVSFRDGVGSGPVSFNTSFTADQFQLSGADGVHWRQPLVRSRWVRFVTRIRFSQDPRRGFVEHWMRTDSGAHFVPQTLLADTGQPIGIRKRMATLFEHQAYLKLGLYRAADFDRPSIAWFDDVRIARNFRGAGC